MSNVARNENESFADYRQRQAEIEEATKRALRPKMFWESYYEGTYYSEARVEKKANKAAKRVHSTPHSKAQQIKYTN